MKQYIGISRDHSGSMQSLASQAMKDYNTTIDSIKKSSEQHDIDTVVSVVECGGGVRRVVTNSGINKLKPLSNYPTPGSNTPLFDSVNDLIQTMSQVADLAEPGVTLLVMAITDGYNNAGRITGNQLATKIMALQRTDKWTFVFRVPRGMSYTLSNLGIPQGNIQEWDTTQRGLEEATIQTKSAISNYYGNVSRGIKSTQTFYADLSGVSSCQVARTMNDISGKVKIFPVTRRSEISEYLPEKTRRTYQTGTAFYQLSKTEARVQPYKMIVIKNRYNNNVYSGEEARNLLGLPTNKNIRLTPGNHGDWTIFIQSTSSNRILLPGTDVLYWPDAIYV